MFLTPTVAKDNLLLLAHLLHFLSRQLHAHATHKQHPPSPPSSAETGDGSPPAWGAGGADIPLSIPASPPGKPRLRILVIGPAPAVETYVRTQYRLGYAQIWQWSPPQPTGNPGEVMRILIRTVL